MHRLEKRISKSRERPTNLHLRALKRTSDLTFSFLALEPLALSVIMAMVLIALTSACAGPRDRRFAPAEAQPTGNLWPPEIIPEPQKVTGIYPLDAREDPTVVCCWAGKHSLMQVPKSGLYQHLVLNIFVPDVPAFALNQERLLVGIPSAHFTRRITGLAPGFHRIQIPIPEKLYATEGPQTITLDSAISFHPSGDGRVAYAFLLLSIYFA